MNCRDLEHIAGCLIGGAVGDALGGPVEFLSLERIRSRYGPRGLLDYAEYTPQGLAEFTDDTQMTLFTAEGLLLARPRGAAAPEQAVASIQHAYLRWLQTQRPTHSRPQGEVGSEGWLLEHPEMWKIKAPGNTCLSALASGRAGSAAQPINNSKGCGGVMRVAPLGFLFRGQDAFRLGVQAAALTHGHPSGYLSAGFLAQMIAEILDQPPAEPGEQRVQLLAAAQASLATLAQWSDHAETRQAVQQALDLAADPHTPAAPETVERMGGGWVGEEALAISLYCALAHPADFTAAVLLAVNHSGDSDSTGAICGNLLGALLGLQAIPSSWRERIELRAEIEHTAALFVVS